MKSPLHSQMAAEMPVGTETMGAIVQDRFGSVPDEVLRMARVPRPTIGDDEVLLHVRAASVDRGTWHIMSGLPHLMRFMGFGLRRPKQPNPGRSVEGTVEAVGRNVTELQVGDEVYGTAEGSFAECARAKAGHVARKPVQLTYEQAAAVPISGVTALQAVRDRGQITRRGEGADHWASGGVGAFAVQIAKAFGAEVTGVCSTTKTEFVRGLGADHVVDYTREDFAEGQHHYDVILDIGGNSGLTQLRRALTPKGRLVIVGGETDGRWLGGFDRQLWATMLSPWVSQNLGMMGAKENSADLSVLAELLDARKVSPPIDRMYEIAETAAALRYFMEGEARGKVVITL